MNMNKQETAAEEAASEPGAGRLQVKCKLKSAKKQYVLNRPEEKTVRSAKRSNRIR